MIETDGPYLLPRTITPKPPHRRNEPMYLPAVLAAVAEARQQEPAEVARITTANALRFFSIKNLISSSRIIPNQLIKHELQ
jgi:TatD DNase family protein